MASTILAITIEGALQLAEASLRQATEPQPLQLMPSTPIPPLISMPSLFNL